MGASYLVYGLSDAFPFFTTIIWVIIDKCSCSINLCNSLIILCLTNCLCEYVTHDENHGKILFYYFVEPERNPSSNPVVLWLNGGLGCLSFDGFVL